MQATGKFNDPPGVKQLRAWKIRKDVAQRGWRNRCNGVDGGFDAATAPTRKETPICYD